MKENFEHIETLFQTLKDSEVPLHEKPSWEKLSPRVQKLNFFRPRLNSFNIFYAALIAGTFLASGYLVVDNILSKNSFKTGAGLHSASVIVYDTLFVNDTLRITDTLYNKTIATYKKEIKLSPTITKTTFDTIQEVSSAKGAQALNTGETPELEAEKAKLENKPNAPRKVKKVTIIKKKQVIVRDTVVVNKGI